MSSKQATVEFVPTAIRKPQFPVQWYAGLKEIAHTEQLVKGLLGANGLFLIFGEPGSSKTSLVLDIGLAIAAGLPWRGRRVKRGLVVYLALEGGATVRVRIAAKRINSPEIPPGVPFALINAAIDFMDPLAIGALIETIRAAESTCGEKAVLIIIDTFARAICGGDENSAQDVGLAVGHADRLRAETGAAVGFVHHSGKDSARGARGSSALRAAVDTEILVEGQANPRIAKVTKQRDLEGGQTFSYELVPIEVGQDPDDAEPITSCVIRHLDEPAAPQNDARGYELRGKAQRQLLAALRVQVKDNPVGIWTLADLREIGRKAGISKGTARSAVDALVTTPYMVATVGGYRFSDGRVEG